MVGLASARGAALMARYSSVVTYSINSCLCSTALNFISLSNFQWRWRRMACEKVADSRHQFDRHDHDGFGRRFERSFIFRYSFVFGLRFVVGEDALHAVFVPAWWKLIFFHRCFFLLRRRCAARALPVSS